MNIDKIRTLIDLFNNKPNKMVDIKELLDTKMWILSNKSALKHGIEIEKTLVSREVIEKVLVTPDNNEMSILWALYKELNSELILKCYPLIPNCNRQVWIINRNTPTAKFLNNKIYILNPQIINEPGIYYIYPELKILVENNSKSNLKSENIVELPVFKDENTTPTKNETSKIPRNSYVDNNGYIKTQNEKIEIYGNTSLKIEEHLNKYNITINKSDLKKIESLNNLIQNYMSILTKLDTYFNSYINLSEDKQKINLKKTIDDLDYQYYQDSKEKVSHGPLYNELLKVTKNKSETKTMTMNEKLDELLKSPDYFNKLKNMMEKVFIKKEIYDKFS